VQGVQQARHSGVVARHVLADVGEVDTEADLRGLVRHGVYAAEQVAPRRRVAHVPPCVLGSARQAGRLPVVGGRVEVVDDDDFVAARHQRVDDVGTDEAGAAGHQHPHVNSPLQRRTARKLSEVRRR